MAPEPAGGGTGGPPGEMPDAWVQSITERVTSIVNSAISQRDKQSDKKFETRMGEIQKLLEGAKPAPATPPVDEGAGGKAGKTKDIELATLNTRIAEAERRADALERARAEERAKNRTITMRQTVTDALATHGIEGARARGALALLNSEGRIAFEDDDSDSIVFKGIDVAGTDVSLRLADGLKEWIKKDEAAKLFLPPGAPGGVRGAGSTPGRANGGAAVTMTKEEASSQFWDALGNAVRGG